jgi:hypothetical protein
VTELPSDHKDFREGREGMYAQQKCYGHLKHTLNTMTREKYRLEFLV